MEPTEQTIQRMDDIRQRIHMLLAHVAGMRDSNLSDVEGLLSVAVIEMDRRLASLRHTQNRQA